MKDLIKIICAIIFPPVAALLQVGLGKHFWINILLTLVGFIPGMVHAIWIIAKNKK
ncbi:MAG: YqaE/Pmp3 family membrane protein [Desulfobacteraceae bacterium]|nr:YqaE/Pmp3 family membrane protein [Desulfobacteraceae bacterium]